MQYALLLQAINDGVGLVVHSLLLVPYYSWKHSHRRHHSNTGSLAKDEVSLAGDPNCYCVSVCSIACRHHSNTGSLAKDEVSSAAGLNDCVCALLGECQAIAAPHTEDSLQLPTTVLQEFVPTILCSSAFLARVCLNYLPPGFPWPCCRCLCPPSIHPIWR